MNKIKVSMVIIAALIVAGCSGTREVLRGFSGVSTKVLEDKRKEALSKEFQCDLITCHNNITKILRDGGAYIYTDDLNKDLIAIYVSNTDTTPVGIFLTEKSSSSTLVEVSSPSTYGKEYISKLVFSGLANALKPRIEKGLPDAKKE
jgi:hypothetical protein